MTNPTRCHKNSDCTYAIPGCRIVPICRNGICKCGAKINATPQCKTIVDCAFFCVSPNAIPFCDTKNGVGKCLCSNK